VIEVAIVRPGPIHGGMVHPYLRRRSGKEKITMPHPSLIPILERTKGVPLFQEQVMQIAIVGAGYSAGEADELRRDMAAWRRNGQLGLHRERLARGFAEHGISKEFAERLYAQIEGFGEYGFPESHAASFALLVYASAWLKVHHPAAFAAALVNSQPMGFYSPSTILQDAQRHGVEVLPIAIERSHWDCTLEGLRTIRVGLRLVKGLGEASGLRIEQARRERPFTNIEDFMARTKLNQRELEALAEAGTLGSMTASAMTREAMWAVRAVRMEGLFEGKGKEEFPTFDPLTRTEQLSLDYERTGFSASDHPLKILRPKLARKKVQSSRDLMAQAHGRRVTTAGYVICRQRPGTASGIVFITMEDEMGFINLVLWNRIFDAYRHVATTSPLLLVRGKLECEKEVIYVVVERMAPLSLTREDDPIHKLPFRGMSRDFH